MRNYKVTAWLSSHLAGDAPELDSLIGREIAYKTGKRAGRKIGRHTPIEEIEDIKAPIARRSINGFHVMCCSFPIISDSVIPEQVDRIACRFESTKLSVLLGYEHRCSLASTKGNYKSRFLPVRVRHADRVVWFFRGVRKPIKNLLKSIDSIGQYRKIGYGQVCNWDMEEIENDFSIFAEYGDTTILMRPIPIECVPDNLSGYTRSFGAWRSPYWHAGFYQDVAVPR